MVSSSFRVTQKLWYPTLARKSAYQDACMKPGSGVASTNLSQAFHRSASDWSSDIQHLRSYLPTSHDGSSRMVRCGRRGGARIRHSCQRKRALHGRVQLNDPVGG